MKKTWKKNSHGTRPLRTNVLHLFGKKPYFFTHEKNFTNPLDLKGLWHEIFLRIFFHQTSYPGPIRPFLKVMFHSDFKKGSTPPGGFLNFEYCFKKLNVLGELSTRDPGWVV